MAAGSTYKQCGCRQGGRRLGQACPKLRRGDGTWSPFHGRWHYQLELPPRADGTRRAPLRHGGFDTQTDASRELRQARDLLAIAAPGDTQTAIRIADAITASVRATRELPDPGRVRKAVGGGHDPAARPPTVGEWLEEWLAAKKKRPGTVRSYAGHIRLYYRPHIGAIPIDRLRVADVASVFEAIEELNDAITDARESGDPALRAAVTGRRLVDPATQQRIRATLRSAINSYIRQHPGMLLANVAALLELPPGQRPRPPVWTGERVRAWQEDFDKCLAGARCCERRAGQPARHLDVHPPPVPGHGLDPRPDPGLPHPRRPAPPARPVAAVCHPRAAPRRRLRAARPRHRPDRRLWGSGTRPPVLTWASIRLARVR
jgi:hypothetical protein